MREVTGDIFSITSDAIVIPTNSQYKMKGKKQPIAIMGAGLALQAAKRWPKLPSLLGKKLQEDDGGDLIHIFYLSDDDEDLNPFLIAFPTKHHYRDDASLSMIEEKLKYLVMTVDLAGWTTVVVPRLGCGLGNLDWEKEVKPLMVKYLDDRFIVVSKE